jgi:hypothetical protein
VPSPNLSIKQVVAGDIIMIGSAKALSNRRRQSISLGSAEVL